MEAGKNPLQDPVQRITPRAIRAWQWSAAFGNLIWFTPPAVAVLLFPAEAAWYRLALLLLLFLSLAIWLAGTFWLPWMRWKRWRYDIDRNEIDLKHGILVVRRTLIPLSRVQHVDTRQGPVLRHYRLADVTISTAATTHEIPALDIEVADQVRDRISRFARLAEDDV